MTEHFLFRRTYATYAVRAAWDEDIAARIAGLDFTADLRATGLTWAEAAADGEVVVRGARPAG